MDILTANNYSETDILKIFNATISGAWSKISKNKFWNQSFSFEEFI
jgi:hypothetical protein